jgi:pimeloyl-ACP methyl ester carboxylesterase
MATSQFAGVRRFAAPRVLLCLTLAGASLVGAGAFAATPQRPKLEPCTLPDVVGEVVCGTHEVFEDRAAQRGRTIPLFIAVIRATEQPAAPDPLFVIAGGPGQGATGVADFFAGAFGEVRRHRDIVAVDMAGTGRSAPLTCPFYPTAAHVAGDFFPLDRVRACREQLAARTDLRRYTTANWADDLDEVRGALGYDRINIYGSSYGTRAALEYVRRHRAHVRSIVLKAIAPQAMRGTMHYAHDTERSLERIFAACAADAACATAYPKVAAELDEVLARAGRGELRGQVPDPAGGSAVDLPISRGAAASVLLGLLQNTNSAVQLPQIVHTTFLGDTAPLVKAIAAYRRALDSGLTFATHLSVMCTEDFPRMDPARAARDDRNTALRDYRVAQLAAACGEWVRGTPPKGFADPVRSDVPALLVSGALDPNTNETWGAEAARHLSRGTHIVIPNLSHGFSSVRECGGTFVAQFIAQGSAEGIDFSCKDRIALPPFPVPAP